MRKPVPVEVITAMVLKRLGKGLDYREIGDKFGVGASTANEKVNDAMLFLIKNKL
jgi:transposase